MEQVYRFHKSADMLIEKILDDDVVMINHMILNQGEALPQHDSNSNVYLMVVEGAVTMQFAEHPATRYEAGCIVNVPGKIKMNISNQDAQQAEFFVVKAPSPRLYQ